MVPGSLAPDRPPLLVFCELDDTVFEPCRLHIDQAASQAIGRLTEARIPLVLCSSRTRAEIELIQQALAIRQPFMSENGAAVYVPQHYFPFGVQPSRVVPGYEVVEFGRPHADVADTLRRTAARVGVSIQRFSDMSVDEVALDCGLPLLPARLAKLREYSEVFRMVDERPAARTMLIKALRASGLESHACGRHYHLGAMRRDAGGFFLRGLFRRAFGDVATAAFGDREVAFPLLMQADVPIVARSDIGDETVRLLTRVTGARLTTLDSLADWADVVFEIAEATQSAHVTT